MKKLLTLILSFCIPHLCLAEPLASMANPAAQQINDSVVKFDKTRIGIIIKNLHTGQILYQQNSQSLFIPASNMKVLTAVAALEELTPEYTYSTYIASSTPQIEQGILTGDLYVFFSGDPSLTSANIVNLFQQLKQSGVNEVIGNIYIDDTLFDQNGLVPAALPEDATYCFAAPVGTGNIDHNCTGVSVRPGPIIGAPTEATVIRTPDAMALINTVITTRSNNCGITAITDDEKDAYILSGCMSLKTSQKEFSLPVQNMRPYLAEFIPLAVNQAQIEWAGNISFGKLPEQAKVLALHQSAPLSELVKHMLKKSDNLYANALFKTLGAKYFHTTGSWFTGAMAIKAILWENNGVNLLSAKLADGAGLSRLNVVTPQQLLDVLATAFNKPQIAAALIPALPISGVDGTLKGRLTEVPYRHRVYAKTGTMSDVVSLSGYVKNANAEVLVFSILINGTPSHLGSYRALEDRICQILITSY